MPDKPDSFIVTTPLTSQTLGDERQADIPVTVTNLTGRPLKVRLRIIPTEPAKAEWIQSAEGWEFDYGLGATRTHQLQARVPNDVPSGTYTFQPEATAEDNEEQFNRGPAVALTVPAPKPSGGIPKWVFPVVGAAAVVLVGVAVALFFVLRSGKADIAVPDVKGKPGSTAVQLISAAELTPDPATIDTEQCDPEVLDQDPTKDKKVGKRTAVKLTLAPCQAPVPVPPVTRPTIKPAVTSITPEDCIAYNTRGLRLVNEGAIGFVLTDGRSRMHLLDNETDGKNALALAQRHTQHCFIGRDNDRPNRKDYIVEYWQGNSGQASTILSEDCLPYNPRNLRIKNEGNTGFLLTDGSSRMLILDNETDADNALILAKQNTAQCFIGRNNRRQDRKSYIVQYWK